MQKIANIPARPKCMGLEIETVTTITPKNITPLASNMASRNVQFTVVKSSLASDTKISDGSAKVPTNVAIPLDSVDDTTLRRPAIYLKLKLLLP